MDGRIIYPDSCRRGLEGCQPYALLESNTDPNEHTFFCVGNNGGKGSGTIPTDTYTCCVKSDYLDRRDFHDKRDLLHQLYVLTAALVHVDCDEGVISYEERSSCNIENDAFPDGQQCDNCENEECQRQ